MTQAGQCDGKVAMTWAQAVKVARRNWDKKRAPYHCRFCRMWHVGRTKHTRRA